jgi:hypothetical protein
MRMNPADDRLPSCLAKTGAADCGVRGEAAGGEVVRDGDQNSKATKES